MANYCGEIDVNTSDAQGQVLFIAPTGAGSFMIQYRGTNPITVSGVDGNPPQATSQAPGTTQTYTIPAPEAGVLVEYTGQITLQWNWVP